VVEALGEFAGKYGTIRVLAEQHRVRIAVVGSVARGEARPDSDIDLLVDFLGHAPTLFDVAALQHALEQLIPGRRAHLLLTQELPPGMRERMRREARWL